MKSRHITEILDKAAFVELSEKDLTIVRLHMKDCLKCQQAFEAARVSSVLLEAQSEIAPSPFFQAKVMNALRREKQNLRKPIAAFRRWWQASVAMVFLMLVTVVGLVAATLLAPNSNVDEAQADASNFNLYSTDAIILNQKPTPDLTTEQVFQVLYERRSDFRLQK